MLRLEPPRRRTLTPTTATRGRSRCRPGVEPLEVRTLLSNIIWANRGSQSGDSDRFGQFFGNNAEKARRVVDAAVAAWAHVVQDFNYQNPGSGDGFAPAANT